MKHLCYKNRVIIYSIALLIMVIFAIVKWIYYFNPKSAVVYYGNNPPYELLGSFDISIVESGHIDSENILFKKYKKKMFAYVSIGEVEKNRSYYPMIKKEWVLGENGVWKSKILDVSNIEYQNFLINHVIKSLIEDGYKNFFFDTIDSYNILSPNNEMKNRYELGIVTFLKKLKIKYPNIKIILNRGFEIIDKVHPYVNGVLFESLFCGLDNKTLAYKDISSQDREWLLEQVKKIQSYNLFVIALDYLPKEEIEKAQETIQKIKNLNIIPYIGERDLQTIGISLKGKRIAQFH